jgi:PAS domain S-box-containing protein
MTQISLTSRAHVKAGFGALLRVDTLPGLVLIVAAIVMVWFLSYRAGLLNGAVGVGLLLALLAAGKIRTSLKFRARGVQAWTRTGKMRLNEQLQGQQSLEALVARVLIFLAEYMNAQAGEVYLSAPDGELRLLARFPAGEPYRDITPRNDGAPTRAPGDMDALRISEKGDARAPTEIQIPVSVDAATHALIRLLFSRSLATADHAFLSHASESLAVAMRSSKERSMLAARPQQVERQRADVRLEEQVQTLKERKLTLSLFNSAHFSCIATNAKGVIQLFNVGAERALGYAAEEVLNRLTPADITDKSENMVRAKTLSIELRTPIAPGLEPLIVKAARGDEDIYELTYIRKDGTRFPAVVSVTALRDVEGSIIGYQLIGTDNTARKRIEAEQALLAQRLRDSQFYTRSLFESNIDALMTTDAPGIITDVNRKMEALTGCTRDELIGAPFKTLFTDPARAEAAIRLALSKGKVTDYELTARDREGNETVVSYNATTLYDRDGRLQGVFAAVREITERKQYERSLREATHRAEHANTAKSECLANMSHAILTPLNTVVGLGYLLEHTTLSEDQRQLLAKIQFDAFALLGVVKQCPGSVHD